MQAGFVDIITWHTEHRFNGKFVRLDLVSAGEDVEAGCCNGDQTKTGCTELPATTAAAAGNDAFEAILAAFQNFFQVGWLLSSTTRALGSSGGLSPGSATAIATVILTATGLVAPGHIVSLNWAQLLRCSHLVSENCYRYQGRRFQRACI